MAYPIELRERVVKAVLEDGRTRREAAELFRVAERTVRDWIGRAQRGELAPRRPGSSRPRKVNGRVMLRLWMMVQQRPGITSEEAAAKLGGLLSAGAIRKLWCGMGLRYKKSRSAPPSRIGRTSLTAAPPGGRCRA